MNPSEMSGLELVQAMVSEGSLRDEEGTLFAHATATCAIIRK